MHRCWSLMTSSAVPFVDTWSVDRLFFRGCWEKNRGERFEVFIYSSCELTNPLIRSWFLFKSMKNKVLRFKVYGTKAPLRIIHHFAPSPLAGVTFILILKLLNQSRLGLSLHERALQPLISTFSKVLCRQCTSHLVGMLPDKLVDIKKTGSKL